MILQQALRRINFKIGTPDDFSGRAINPIVSNRIIIDELNSQLLQYANITKGIQDVFSFPLNRNIVRIEAPTLALRSEAYFSQYVINTSTIFLIDMRRQSEVYRVFTSTPVNGITNWLMPWNEGNKSFLGAFPTNSTSATISPLTSAITSFDTTIPVVSTAGLVQTNGRLTIGTEKVAYQDKDPTNFFGCLRGVEQTTPQDHMIDTDVIENNVVIYYSRKPIPVEIDDDNILPPSLLARDIEVVDEHMEGVIKAVAYNILVKLDTERIVPYKIDYLDLYTQYAKDIKKGYYRGRMGTDIRDPYEISESGTPYGTNWMY